MLSYCVTQMIASKYLNDEGEEESLLNSEWAKIGQTYLYIHHTTCMYTCVHMCTHAHTYKITFIIWFSGRKTKHSVDCLEIEFISALVRVPI